MTADEKHGKTSREREQNSRDYTKRADRRCHLIQWMSSFRKNLAIDTHEELRIVYSSASTLGPCSDSFRRIRYSTIRM